MQAIWHLEQNSDFVYENRQADFSDLTDTRRILETQIISFLVQTKQQRQNHDNLRFSYV